MCSNVSTSLLYTSLETDLETLYIAATPKGLCKVSFKRLLKTDFLPYINKYFNSIIEISNPKSKNQSHQSIGMAIETFIVGQSSYHHSQPKNEDHRYKAESILSDALTQLKAYFHNQLKNFNLPLFIIGTEFQTLVWQKLLLIPYGHLITYKDLAIMSGNPKASRAVGMANHNNPIPIIIPCHRVIDSQGKLRGYGSGLDIKSKLIQLEEKKFQPHLPSLYSQKIR